MGSSQVFIVIPVDVVFIVGVITSSLDSHIESLRLLNTLCHLSASGRPTDIKMDSGDDVSHTVDDGHFSASPYPPLGPTPCDCSVPPPNVTV